MLSWAPHLGLRAGGHVGSPTESSKTPGRRDQALFLNPGPGGCTHLFLGRKTMKAALGAGSADSEWGPRGREGQDPCIYTQPPKTQTSHTQSSLSGAPASDPSSNPSCPDRVAARRLPSPPCRLSEVRQSRKRAAGKAQVPMIPGRVGGHTPCEPLNTSAGWGPLPRPPAVSDRGSVGRPQGASPHLPLQQESSPWPSPCPTPHPSWVLTAGTGPHLAHEVPLLLSGSGTLAPGPEGSDVTPAAGEKQAGTVGTQAQPGRGGSQAQKCGCG